ncbi:hypothetical protein D9615_010286 [Tricholomella constricta]|uniref:Uncharacterized protein n=1 Tax=Tricholomella constricta TaxID=117010 RepID=A0A8H5LS07_9AGAR|nr:hypothetical protein D9615_010286 [Tricholomella constricta]
MDVAGCQPPSTGNREQPTFQHPIPPPVCTTRANAVPGVPPVPLQVFGWSFDIQNDVIKWANDHDFEPGMDEYFREQLARSEIRTRLPFGYRAVAQVHDAASPNNIIGAKRYCFVIGSNKSQEDIDLAFDMTIINQFRAVLGPDAQLQWHKYRYRADDSGI